MVKPSLVAWITVHLAGGGNFSMFKCKIDPIAGGSIEPKTSYLNRTACNRSGIINIHTHRYIAMTFLPGLMHKAFSFSLNFIKSCPCLTIYITNDQTSAQRKHYRNC